MRPLSRWLSSCARFWRWPRCSWSFPSPAATGSAGTTPFGYLSDLALGSLLVLLLHRRSLWFALPVMLLWCLFLIGNAELVGAVGRMPEPSDLKYLLDPQFVSSSTQGGGLAYLPLALGLGGATLLCVLLWRRRGPRLPRYAYALPAAFWRRMSACNTCVRATPTNGSSTTCRTSCWPARSAVANWRSKTGSPTTVRTPCRTSPGSTSSTFPERRCWPAEARATS